MDSTIFIKDWTDKQKEVWSNVETYTNLIMKDNFEEFLKFFHKDYSGWNYYEILPVGKDAVIMEAEHLKQNQKIISYDLNPVAIKIHGNVAIVHYYYSVCYKNQDGRRRNKKGRYTDILLKQKKKWVLIGDHMGVFKHIKDRNTNFSRT